MFKPLKPPCTEGVGRPLSELVHVYKEQSSRSLSNFTVVADGIYTTILRGLSLLEYLEAKRRDQGFITPDPEGAARGRGVVICDKSIPYFSWGKIFVVFVV